MVEGTRRVVRAAFRPLRGHDLSLHAAAITFFAGIAIVPVALLAIWLTGLLAGADRVRRLAFNAVDTLPTASAPTGRSPRWSTPGSG